NHRMAGSLACVPIRRMNRILLRNCRCLSSRRKLMLIADVWLYEPPSIFARNGCARKQPRFSPIGKDTATTHKNASEVPERHHRKPKPRRCRPVAALELMETGQS